MPLEPTAYLTTLRADAEKLALAGDADLDAPVPTCPDWNLRDLVVHLGRVQRWVTEIVRTSAQERPEFPKRPDEGADLTAWFREGADQLVETLGSADPEAKVWNWGDGTAKFWHRRQAQEAAIHRWDAQHAVGAEQPIDGALAIDGVDELITMILEPRNPTGDGKSIHLHATDREGEWTVTFGEDGFHVERGHGKGDAAIRGTASDLVLWAWNRLPARAAVFETFGDEALLDRWKALTKV